MRLFSLASSTGGDPSVKVDIGDTEGIVGTQVVLGVVEAPVRALFQGVGWALRISLKIFRAQLDNSKALVGDLRLRK